MREQRIRFSSGAHSLAGLMRLPDEGAGPLACIVQGPAWLGSKDAVRNIPYHEALTERGLAVLAFDAAGVGESEGNPKELFPQRQVEDLINAITYVTTRSDVNADAIGTFGTGATGGGNAVMAAAMDPRIKCVVSQVPIADGRAWLQQMRTEAEWSQFEERVLQDARERVEGREGRLVAPRGEIALITPERREAEKRGFVKKRPVEPVLLASAEAIMRYRPIDVAHRVGNLLVVAVENDTVTPTHQAMALYEVASTPKRMLLLRGVSHHEAYTARADVVIPEIVDWFVSHLLADSKSEHYWPTASVEVVG